LLNLEHAPELFVRTEALARLLAIAMDNSQAEQDLIMELFRRSRVLDDKPFVDVATLCLTLARECGDLPVRSAAEKLGDLLISPDPVTNGRSETGEGRPLVVEHGRNAAQTAGLQGISLYAPSVAPNYDVEAARPYYEKLVFTKEALWGELVHALAEASA
jgi:hypothetical protein